MKKQLYFASVPRARSAISRYAPVVFSSLAIVSPVQVFAEQYFNPAFLSSDPSAIADLSRFNNEGGQAPGSYRVDIYINDTFVATRDVDFKYSKATVAPEKNTAAPVEASSNTKSSDTTDTLVPFFSIKELETFGVNIKSMPALKETAEDKAVNLESIVLGSRASFDFEKQRLDLSIPQIAMKNDARGYIAPEQWDEGINALLLNYNFTGNETKAYNERQSDKFLSLQSGIVIQQ